MRQNLARAAKSGIAHIKGTNPLILFAGQETCPGRKKIRLGEKGTRSPSRRQAKRDRQQQTRSLTLLHIPPATMSSTQSVQCFGKKKTATAVAHCKVSGRIHDGWEDGSVVGGILREKEMGIEAGKSMWGMFFFGLGVMQKFSLTWDKEKKTLRFHKDMQKC